MVDGSSNRTASPSFIVGSAAAILVVVVIMTIPQQPDPVEVPEARIASTDDAASAESPAGVAATRFVTTIRRPSGPPVIELREPDPQGRVGNVACSTCHSVRPANFANRRPEDLDQFHQNMPLSHGKLSCYSCHNPEDADALRLADGTAVEYPDVMTLCSQCHGSQARDYAHGAHGGMTGYWDLSRGPRIRNNCIDCHDPHVPSFPSMRPTFKPRDRFLKPPAPHADDSHRGLASGEANHE